MCFFAYWFALSVRADLIAIYLKKSNVITKAVFSVLF